MRWGVLGRSLGLLEQRRTRMGSVVLGDGRVDACGSGHPVGEHGK